MLACNPNIWGDTELGLRAQSAQPNLLSESQVKERQLSKEEQIEVI